MSPLLIVGIALIALGTLALFFPKIGERIGGLDGGALGAEAKAKGPMALFVLGAVLIFADFAWVRGGGETDKPPPTIPPTAPTIPPTVTDDMEDLFPGGFTFGDNNELDRLWRSCERSVWSDCDTLYEISDIGSDYEWFGATCGGLPFNPNPDTEWCDPFRLD
jgi:hypothetical protein